MTYRERFETAWMKEHPLHGATAFKRSGLNPDAYVNTRVQDGWLMWQAAEAAAIERCAELIDGINDSAGDRASYDNREMHEGEVERMNALSDAANAIRALLPKEE